MLFHNIEMSPVTKDRFLLLTENIKDEIQSVSDGRYTGFVRIFLKSDKRGKDIFIDFSGDTDVCYFGERREEGYLSFTGTIRELEEFLVEYRKR